ncbi:hypothetical protein A1O1_04345 [Capronia coronata CBS 617.96]|uniref:Acid phosphatase-like protein n=1 Tax=Capronia coronata CBS 617.96 TaxID=1182541 RepID=W9YNH7_9EURO|nr:uncharacterized protein A1O1_04345 [Capronia coronata CBS 617.96]EXJ91235.1 hypothetical protein A1O1_04345 [Capronia coronata CBS 617.96]
MHGWGLFFFLLFLLLIFAVVGWIGFTQYNARKQGLPAPSLKSWKTYIPFVKAQGSSNYPAPRHAGPVEWIREQFSRLTNKRTARGAYEEADSEGGYSGAGRRGRGVEDDAWDTRVGNEDPYVSGPAGYSGYEEQELGLAPTPGLHNEPYAGGSGVGDGGDYLGAAPSYVDVGARGRPVSAKSLDPFGDQNEAPSLRSVSPRPEADTSGRGHAKGSQSLDTQGSGDGSSSPTSTRKSAFREGI